MKITKTFDNASLRTVNEGYIELDYNGKTHCFHNASVISVNNGNISIEINWKPKKGELIKAVGCHIDCYVIFNYKSKDILYTYGSINMVFASIGYFKFDDDQWAYNHNIQLLPVTPEEALSFVEFCKTQGKIWNAETFKWEDYKWVPKHSEKYWYVASWGEVMYRHYISSNVDQCLLQINNAFQTKEQADTALEKVKELFKSL